MNTTEYRFEFKLLEDTDEWFRTADVCFDEESAIKRFDELIRRSNMEWRIVEEKIVSSVIRNEKGKA